MSEADKKVSEKASEEPQNASVLDILYCDATRIGAFLSQFDELGVATRVTVSESMQKARGRSFKFNVGGGMPGLGNATFNVERGAPSESGQQGETRDYDPLWANAFALLDYLETNGLIIRSLDAARIGQFVLATGSMSVMDLTLFKDLWASPAFKALIKSSQQQETAAPAPNRQQRRAGKQKGAVNSEDSAASNATDIGFSIVSMLPHATQARVLLPTTNQTVWSSLRPEGMVISPSDIFLKHGLAVAGEWSMMGILDALPDTNASGRMSPDGIHALSHAQAAAENNPFGEMMLNILPFVRPMLGRPFDAFGMTPLLIYRKISG